MSDLKALRSKLMAVQQKSVGSKLSERNVVEIMQKLVSKFELVVIYTLSGKEYLTPTRLVQEIRKEVLQEGRLSLLDLPNILGVSIETIEQHAPSVISKDIFLINGQLLSSLYISSMCQEINISLQEAGQISLADLTLKYSLPMGFLKEQIEIQLGKSMQAQLSKNNVLVTDSYLSRHLARLRGYLRGSSKPVDLKRFDSNLAVTQVQRLIESKEVKGVLEGSVFTPAAFQTSVWDEVTSTYLANRCIDYDFIKKRLTHLGVNDYRKVCEKLPNGEYLKESYINLELIAEIKVSLQEFMKNKSYADFYDIEIPGTISEEDIEGLLTEGLYCTQRFVYTEKAIDQGVNLLRPLIAAFSEETKESSKGKKKESLSLEVIMNELKKKKFLNAPIEFLEGFSDAVYSKASRQITEARENRTKPAEPESNSVFQDFNYLFLCNKGLQAIQKSYQNIKPLQAHYCKTLASNLLSEMLRVELNHHGIPTTSIKTSDRSKLILKLPEYLREIFIKLNEKIASKDLEGFITELLANIKDIPIISLRSVDKKTERNFFHKLKSDLKTQIKSMISSEKFLEVGVLAVKLRLLDSNILLESPTEKWGVAISLDIFQSQLPKDVTFEFLQLLSLPCDKPQLLELLPELSSSLSLS